MSKEKISSICLHYLMRPQKNLARVNLLNQRQQVFLLKEQEQLILSKRNYLPQSIVTPILRAPSRSTQTNSNNALPTAL